MNVTLDLYPHPVTAEGRATRRLTCPAGASVQDLVDGLGLDTGALEVRLDDVSVPVPARAGRALRDRAIVHLRPTLGGGGDTNPLRTVLQIALILTVVHGVPAAFPGLEGWALHAAQAGTAVIGGMVINAIAPPRLPELAGPDAGGEPQYSLTLGRNRARRYGPAPLVLGRHRVLPDLASQQWTEFDGDDQYLSAIFNFGIGTLDLDDANDESTLKIGATALATYSDVTYRLSDDVTGEFPNEADGTPLVPGNVDVVAGAALESAAQWTVRAAPGAVKVAIDFVGRLFRHNREGEYSEQSVRVDIKLTATIPPETEGGATRSRSIPYVVNLAHDAPSPLRHTWSVAIPTTGDLPADGVWQVHVRRTTTPTTDADRERAADADTFVIYDDVTWQALRVYQADPADYRGHKRLAVRIRASGQLSGALDGVSAVVQQKVPVPAGDAAWSAPAATSNPAYIFRAVARGWLHPNGRLLAGAGLPTTRLDDAAIRRWGTWCAAQGLECNLVVGQSMSVEALLGVIAQCGRASPTWASGRLGVIYEDAAAVPTALVSPGSIVAGTFSLDYPAGQVVDEVVCRYVDPGLDWQVSEVRRTVPGVAAPVTSTTVTLRGVTSRRQAAMEANLLAARQRYHRRRLAWEMGPGAVTAIARGDVVHITHSLIDSGETGRLAGLDGATLALGRDVALPVGTHTMLLELPDGRLHTAEVAAPVSSTHTATVDRVTLTTPPPRPEDETARGWIAEDVRWRLYADDAPPLQARITSVEPRIDGSARFTAIDEVAAYHAAATTGLDVDPPVVHGALPVVVAIYAWTQTVAGAAGDVAEVHIQIETTGEWRGGSVAVSDATSNAAVWTGRIGQGEQSVSWLAGRDAVLAIRVVPDGNPGGARSIDPPYDVDGPPVLPLPRWRGAWRAGVSYQRADFVTYGDRSYIAQAVHTSSTSNQPSGTNTSNTTWALMAGAGADGAPGRPGRAGIDGLRGRDGNFREYIFCRVAQTKTLASFTTAQKPSNNWAYDVLEDGPRARSGVTWYDGLPPERAGRTKVCWCVRVVPGNATRSTPLSQLGDWSAPQELAEDGADGTGINYENNCWIAGDNLKVCGGTLTARRGQRFTFPGGFRSNPLLIITPHSSFRYSYTSTTWPDGNDGDPLTQTHYDDVLPHYTSLSATGYTISGSNSRAGRRFTNNTITFDFVAIGLPPAASS